MFFTILAGLIANGLFGTQLAAAPNVTTGYAPLHVFFNSLPFGAVGTLNTLNTVAFKWDFGDISTTGQGTWGYGQKIGASKNIRYAASGGHLYETPGTYTWTLTVTNPGGLVQTRQGSITVLDPNDSNAPFAGANTICLSNSADFTGAPTDPLTVKLTTSAMNDATLLSFISSRPAGNFRILYKCGDTFSANSTSNIIDFAGRSVIRVGSFGTGAQPICINNSTTTSTAAHFNLGTNYTGGATGTDVVINGINIQGNAANLTSRGCQNFDGAVQAYDPVTGVILETKGRFVAANCTFVNMGWPIALSGTGCAAINNNISQCTGAGTAGIIGIGLGFNYGVTNCSVLGNYIDRSNTGEHGIRAQGIAFADIYSNYVKQCGGTKHLMTFREFATGASFGLPSQYIFRSNNDSDGAGGANMSSYCQYAPQNTNAYGLLQYIVDDHNHDRRWDWAAAPTNYSMPNRIVTGNSIIFRHNTIDGTDTAAAAGTCGFQVLQLQNGSSSSSPVTLESKNIVFRNNSINCGANMKASAMNIASNVHDVAANDNIFYAPLCVRDASGSGGQATFVFGTGAGNIAPPDNVSTSLQNTHNSTLTNIKSNDPLFVVSNPVNGADFALQPGSYAIGAGTGGANMGANPLDLSAA